MRLGQNIRSKRTELKLSQEYIAEQLGVSRQAVSKWETGQTEPTAKNLVELAQLFNMTVSELVEPEKISQTETTVEKRNWHLGFERFAIIAYTASVIMWTIETNDPGFVPFVNILIFIAAVIMAINIFKLPKSIRTKVALKELGYCVLLYCIATFLTPLIKNVFSSIIIMICCVVYIKYIRFEKNP